MPSRASPRRPPLTASRLASGSRPTTHREHTRTWRLAPEREGRTRPSEMASKVLALVVFRKRGGRPPATAMTARSVVRSAAPSVRTRRSRLGSSVLNSRDSGGSEEAAHRDARERMGLDCAARPALEWTRGGCQLKTVSRVLRTRTYVPSDKASRVGGLSVHAAGAATFTRRPKPPKPRAVELFAGAGGLALGLHRAGFRTALAVDWDERAYETLKANKRKYTRGWDLKREDVRKLDYATLELGDVDIVSAGAPCQPFSIGGQLRGEGDPRNMFPEVVRAVRELRPRAFLFENVRGLLFPRARPYFDYILAQLRNPSRTRRADEDWLAHKAALDRIPEALHEYRVEWRLLNAADFGLPQNRPRLVGPRQAARDPRRRIRLPPRRPGLPPLYQQHRSQAAPPLRLER